MKSDSSISFWRGLIITILVLSSPLLFAAEPISFCQALLAPSSSEAHAKDVYVRMFESYLNLQTKGPSKVQRLEAIMRSENPIDPTENSLQREDIQFSGAFRQIIKQLSADDWLDIRGQLNKMGSQTIQQDQDRAEKSNDTATIFSAAQLGEYETNEWISATPASHTTKSGRTFFAVASQDMKLYIFEMVKGKLVKIGTPQSTHVSLRFSPKFAEMPDGKLMIILPVNDKSIYSYEFTDNFSNIEYKDGIEGDARANLSTALTMPDGRVRFTIRSKRDQTGIAEFQPDGSFKMISDYRTFGEHTTFSLYLDPTGRTQLMAIHQNKLSFYRLSETYGYDETKEIALTGINEVASLTDLEEVQPGRFLIAFNTIVFGTSQGALQLLDFDSSSMQVRAYQAADIGGDNAKRPNIHRTGSGQYVISSYSGYRDGTNLFLIDTKALVLKPLAIEKAKAGAPTRANFFHLPDGRDIVAMDNSGSLVVYEFRDDNTQLVKIYEQEFRLLASDGPLLTELSDGRVVAAFGAHSKRFHVIQLFRTLTRFSSLFWSSLPNAFKS